MAGKRISDESRSFRRWIHISMIKSDEIRWYRELYTMDIVHNPRILYLPRTVSLRYAFPLQNFVSYVERTKFDEYAFEKIYPWYFSTLSTGLGRTEIRNNIHNLNSTIRSRNNIAIYLYWYHFVILWSRVFIQTKQKFVVFLLKYKYSVWI